jgi:uncharacterized membrane protein YcaP (DUF421 family)
MENGTLIHKHIQEIPREEQWLFVSKNKAAVDELKQALKQKAHKTIDLDALLNSLEDE